MVKPQSAQAFSSLARDPRHPAHPLSVDLAQHLTQRVPRHHSPVVHAADITLSNYQLQIVT